MATYTTNYNLSKPEGTDSYNHLIYDNPNMDAIDATMKENADTAVSKASCVKTGTNHAVTRQNPDAVVFRFTATGDFDTGDTMTVDGVIVSVYLPNGAAPTNKAYVINTEVIASIQGTRVTLYCPIIPTATNVSFDNSGTSLVSTNVEGAIKEAVTPRLVLSIPANSYATYALALVAVETAFTALSSDDKLKAAIVVNDTAVLRVDNIANSFSRVRCVNANAVMQSMHLTDHTYILWNVDTNGNTVTNLSTTAQSSKIDLYIL